MSTPTTPLPSGTQLGRYTLRHRLAEGGMAAVYLAQLTSEAGFERWVAVKVVHPKMSADRRFTTMLLDEARISARVHHPHVCAVTDFGEQDGMVYLVMEYLQGETLSAILRRGWKELKAFPAWLAARVVSDAARGLHAAHELRGPDGEPLGLVHRDMSPQNIVVLYEGMSKVVDFGIARAKGRMTVTKAGEVKGKLSYMAPEQVDPHITVDRRADIWALGVVLWEASLGQRLFKGDHPADTLKQVLHARIPRPTEITSHYPAELEAIVLAALERDRDARLATAEELSSRLDQYLFGLERPAGHPQVGRWMARHFDDRLLIRQALLESPEAESDVSIAELHSETTLGSQLASAASLGSDIFAPPEKTMDPGGAPAEGSRADTIDATVRVSRPQQVAMPDVVKLMRKAQAARRWSFTVAALGVVALLLAAGLYFAPRKDANAGTSTDRTQESAHGGTLWLRSVPAATVQLGDRSLGETPIEGVALPEGRHEITLWPVGGGRSSTTTVEIHAGRRTKLSVRLRD